MNSLHIGILVCSVLLLGWWAVMRVRKVIGVWRLRHYAFPRPWLKHLHGAAPVYHRVPWELRAPLQDRMLSFIDGKVFRPGGTLQEVSEEQRVVIAAHASLLLVNREAAGCYGEVLGVRVHEGCTAAAALESATPSHPAVLWDAARRAALDPHDTVSPLVPALLRRMGATVQEASPDLRLTAWGRLQSDAFAGQLGFEALGNFMERYEAAGDAAAFCAAATEAFFMHSQSLLQRDRALYEALRQFYKLDPARWRTLTR
jgi:hypothetical protein